MPEEPTNRQQQRQEDSQANKSIVARVYRDIGNPDLQQAGITGLCPPRQKVDITEGLIPLEGQLGRTHVQAFGRSEDADPIQWMSVALLERVTAQKNRNGVLEEQLRISWWKATSPAQLIALLLIGFRTVFENTKVFMGVR